MTQPLKSLLTEVQLYFGSFPIVFAQVDLQVSHWARISAVHPRHSLAWDGVDVPIRHWREPIENGSGG